MAGPYRFDSLTEFAASTIGEPGKRFFFLIIGSDQGWVRVWLEKEQLRALSEGVDELLDQLEDRETERPSSMPAAVEPDSASILGEFTVTRMAVGYDGDRDAITLIAHEEGSEDNARPTLACRATREQAAGLAVQSIAVCNSGRPICPLCERPIDPAGHLCPRTNGHRVTGF
jgi:uncharacterized repeat protein (TIGR03847 family)